MYLLQVSIAAGLTGIAAKATLLLGIGWCGALILRRAPASARHLVWLAVIVGILLLPALTRMTPLHVALLPSADAARAVAAPAGATAITTNSSPVPQGLVPHHASWTVTLSYCTLAIMLWLGVAAALIGWLIVGMLSVRSIQRRARVLDSIEWTSVLRDAARRLGLAPLPRLVMSDKVNMAFTCGAFTPTIVLPASAAEWTEERRQAVLLHELAHVRRRDLAGHLISRIACAIYWFHPLVWIAARRLRAECELACDDLVLANGMRASDYAQHLLDMVTTLGHRQGAPLAAMPLVRRSEFEGRLLAILDRAQRRTALGRTYVGALVGVLAISTVSLGAVVPVPRTQLVSAAAVPIGPSIVALPAALPVAKSAGVVLQKRRVERYDRLVPYVRGPSKAGGGAAGYGPFTAIDRRHGNSAEAKVPVTRPDTVQYWRE